MEYTKRQLLICFQNFGAFQVIINKQINVDNYTLHVSNKIQLNGNEYVGQNSKIY